MRSPEHRSRAGLCSNLQIGDLGPRKDPAIVLPKKKLSVFFDADNPGPWMLHCHNAYHGEAGMTANMAYRA